MGEEGRIGAGDESHRAFAKHPCQTVISFNRMTEDIEDTLAARQARASPRRGRARGKGLIVILKVRRQPVDFLLQNIDVGFGDLRFDRHMAAAQTGYQIGNLLVIGGQIRPEGIGRGDG